MKFCFWYSIVTYWFYISLPLFTQLHIAILTIAYTQHNIDWSCSLQYYPVRMIVCSFFYNNILLYYSEFPMLCRSIWETSIISYSWPFFTFLVNVILSCMCILFLVIPLPSKLTSSVSVFRFQVISFNHDSFWFRPCARPQDFELYFLLSRNAAFALALR